MILLKNEKLGSVSLNLIVDFICEYKDCDFGDHNLLLRRGSSASCILICGTGLLVGSTSSSASEPSLET
jgi:hypothetical protein